MSGGRLRFEIDTVYPNDGSIKVTILECPASLEALHFRVPAWSKVNDILWGWWRDDYGRSGLDVTQNRPGYISLRGRFKPGLILYLYLDLPIRVASGRFGHVDEAPRPEERDGETVYRDAAIFKGPCMLVLAAAHNDLPFGRQRYAVRAGLSSDGKIELPPARDKPGPKCRWSRLHHAIDRVTPVATTAHLSPLAELTWSEDPRAKGTFDIVT